MKIYTDSQMGMYDYVSWKQYPTQTLIHKDVAANTECWGMGCEITVKLTQAMIPTCNRLQV